MNRKEFFKTAFLGFGALLFIKPKKKVTYELTVSDIKELADGLPGPYNMGVIHVKNYELYVGDDGNCGNFFADIGDTVDIVPGHDKLVVIDRQLDETGCKYILVDESRFFGMDERGDK